MNILFTACCNHRQNLIKTSDQMAHGVKKTTTKVIHLIKNGFVALLKSVSNSFKCMVKMFTVTKTRQESGYNNMKPERVFFEAVPSVSAEKGNDCFLEDNPFNDASRQHFNNLKAEMHIKLNNVFANRTAI